MRFFFICFLYFTFIISCVDDQKSYECIDSVCLEDDNGSYETANDCIESCIENLQNSNVVVTFFLYENCPISQYMCGPIRDAYYLFNDSLKSNFIFRGFSPNLISSPSSLENFVLDYEIPFNLYTDFDYESNDIGIYTSIYQPIVTPEVFIEVSDSLIYRGMIDNSYLTIGQWTPPTENYLNIVLNSLVLDTDIDYFETDAVGCLINY
tara:strand:- start:13878 stop:14501 length:624 start_codon:yes stop_codon:yes gene_type:complete